MQRKESGLVIDNFAGGGGASTGIARALGRSPDFAINHDAEALSLHAANHPDTHHLTADIWDVDPAALCGGTPVDLAWFSPDCRHFSRAKGGKPVSKRVRGLAWVVTRWARAVRPRIILLENVPELATWGPLLSDDTPDPARAGLTFRRWLGQLRSAGYDVEMRELAACDYGAPTSRKRLFVVARCDGQPIRWPAPTHGPGLKPYRTASECIDWSLPCPSIFERSKPLADKTLRRIARGIQRFVTDSASPFLVPLTHAGDDRAHAISEPFRTITGANRGEFALVAPTIARYNGEGLGQHLGESLDTITTRDRFALIAPTLIQTGYGERPGQAPRILDLHQPLGTAVAGGQKHALVSAFLAKHYGERDGGWNGGSALDAPIGAVTVRDHHSLITAHLTKFYGTSTGAALSEPAPTITSGGEHIGLVRALLEKHAPPAQAQLSLLGSLEPGVVRIGGERWTIVDIGLRMLQPRELYRAQGFGDDYLIDLPGLSKTAKVRLCGNSVCPDVAEALVRANAGQAIEVAA